MKSKDKKKNTIIISIILIILILLLLIFCICTKNSNTNPVENGVLPSLTTEEQLIFQQEIDETQFGFLINSTPAFASGNLPGNLRIQNLPDNKYSMQIIIKDNSNLELYKSPIIKPNQYIEYDKLNRELGNGIYDCKVYINVLNSDNSLAGKIESNIKVYIGYGIS